MKLNKLIDRIDKKAGQLYTLAQIWSWRDGKKAARYREAANRLSWTASVMRSR
jgi:hypothetical protein